MLSEHEFIVALREIEPLAKELSNRAHQLLKDSSEDPRFGVSGYDSRLPMTVQDIGHAYSLLATLSKKFRDSW